MEERRGEGERKEGERARREDKGESGININYLSVSVR